MRTSQCTYIGYYNCYTHSIAAPVTHTQQHFLIFLAPLTTIHRWVYYYFYCRRINVRTWQYRGLLAAGNRVPVSQIGFASAWQPHALARTVIAGRFVTRRVGAFNTAGYPSQSRSPEILFLLSCTTRDLMDCRPGTYRFLTSLISYARPYNII